MHMNLSVMLVAKQNTQITTYILRMGRLSMGLCKSSGAHLRICCLTLFRLLPVHQSIRNPSVFGKVMQISYLLIIAALTLHILALKHFPFCFFFLPDTCFMIWMSSLMLALLPLFQNLFWQQHVNFNVYMARMR